MERARCFSRRALLKIAEDQNLPVLCRKAHNGAANRLSQFYAIDGLKRGFAGRGESIEITQRLAGWPARFVIVAAQKLPTKSSRQ